MDKLQLTWIILIKIPNRKNREHYTLKKMIKIKLFFFYIISFVTTYLANMRKKVDSACVNCY